MTPHLIKTTIAILCIFCLELCGGPTSAPATQPAATQPAATAEIAERDWVGVYASTSEIRGFAGTVLVLEKGVRDEVDYRLRSHSDVRSANAIEQDEEGGRCLIDGRALYLPHAYGYMHDGKPRLRTSVSRWTFVEINGHKVLMRDDALRAFREQNKLYDYGILVKVRDQPDVMLDLRKVEHPSIKMLYSDPNKPWEDPFVHGPNSR